MNGTPIRLALVAAIALTVTSCATVPELTAPPETPPAIVGLYAPTVEHRVEIGNNIIVTWDAIAAADRYVAVVTREDGSVTHTFPTTETSLLVVPPAGRWWLTVTASRGEIPGPSSTPVLVTIPPQ